MGSSSFAGSQRLMKLAEQLRQYKTNNIDEQEQQKFENSAGGGGVVPPTGRFKSDRAAAVLICLFEGKEGDLRVILTKRSSALSTHSGEVALPGGKVEDGDASYVETALREAKEEIGLDPSLTDVAVLEPFTAKNGMMVVPVIGILGNKDAFTPIPNAAEVETIFDAPLEMFLKDENRRETEKEWMGSRYLLHFFDHQVENQNFVIWALTAGILIRAASIVYQQPPAFQERRPPFWKRSRH